MKDGTYHVKADNSDNIDRNFVDAKIKIKNDKVTDVKVGHLTPGLPGDLSSVNEVKRIVKNGNADADVVTGATITARAIVNATNKAIELAENKMSEADALNPDIYPQKKPHYIKYPHLSSKKYYLDQVQIKEKADVIVVGAGASGLSAAISAAQNGKKVLVLEKAGIAGGAMNRSAIIFQADDDVHGFKDDWLKQSEGQADSELVNRITKKAPETMKWLEKIGIDFDDHFAPRPLPYLPEQAARLHVASKAPMVGLGSYLTKSLLKRAKELHVKIIYDHPVISLILANAETNRIVGVVSEYHDQKTFYQASSIVLATASVDSNKALAQNLNNTQFQILQNKASLTPVYNTGDGIALGMNVGASLDGLSDNVMSQPVNRSGSPSGFANPKGVNMQALVGQNVMPAINVNTYGRRYVPEDKAWGYVSRANLQEEKETQKPTYIIFGANSVGDPGSLWKDRASLEADVKKGQLVNSPLVEANTVSELASKIGVDQEGLKKTISLWNKEVDHGKDVELGRKTALIKIEAPYYAWQNLDYSLGSIGGLKINAHGQVLNDEEEVIRGLYAIGMNAGGWLGSYYSSEGIALTGSIVLGRLIGQYLS